ncbi:MAG TPA: hypothetical protein VMF30_07560, partial [Pirellulales bacterium]|nr:hypothetical protein [Pirellulales bacterium]
MRNRICLCAVMLLALVSLAGCGKPAGSGGGDSQAALESPDKVLAVFLKAICANDQEKMFDMLTATARQALRERDMSPGVNAGDGASYEVIEFEYVDEGAHVACNWIEKQEDGTPSVTPVVWIMHKEP